ncbi:MAG: beta-propeller fold lactonase family protein [Deltaproteobacteria bacterium]
MAALVACSGEEPTEPGPADAGPSRDAGFKDAGPDVGRDGGDSSTDGGRRDAGSPDRVTPTGAGLLGAVLENDLGFATRSEIDFTSDGRFAYVAVTEGEGIQHNSCAACSGSIAVYRVDDTTGAFELRQNVWLDSLPTLVHVGAQDAHVYAQYQSGDWVAFARDAEGLLTEVARGDVDITGPSAAWNPDGTEVYVSEYSPPWRIVRMAATGDGPVELVETLDDAAMPEVGDQTQIRDLALSPDGMHLYAADASAGDMLVFARDPSTGALQFQTRLDGGLDFAAPRQLAVTADGGHVVAASAGGDLVVLTRDADAASPDFGDLTLLEVIDNVSDPGDLLFGPNDAQLYVASVGLVDQRATVRRYARQTDASAQDFGRLMFLDETTPGPDDAYLASIVLTNAADELVVLVHDTDPPVTVNGGSIYRYPRAADGALSEPIVLADRDPGSLHEVQGVAWHPDGQTVYASSVFAFAEERNLTAAGIRRFDRQDGRWVAGELASCQQDPTFACTAGKLRLGPDGTWGVSIGTEGSDDAFFLWDVDPVTKDISLVDVQTNRGNPLYDFRRAQDIAVRETVPGRGVAVVASPEGLVAFQFEVGVDARASAEVEPVDEPQIEDAVGVTFSGDGANAYAVTEDSIVAFDAEMVVVATSAGRSVLQVIRAADVSGMDGAQRVVVAPDGEHVYVVSEVDAALVTFARGADGTLTFVSSQPNGLGGIGETGPGGGRVVSSDYALDVSPDGRTLVVAADLLFGNEQVEDGVAVFDRDPATGQLTERWVARHAVDGAYGLAGVSDVAVAPNGATFAVTAAVSRALSEWGLGD